MKGVSSTFQFLLFFVIGIGLFTSISSVFRLQLDVFRDNAADATRKLDNSFVSAMAVVEKACFTCDRVDLSVKFQNTSANYFYIISGGPDGITVATEPGSRSISSSAHNLNASLAMSGAKASVETITLTLTKTQNKLEVN